MDVQMVMWIRRHATCMGGARKCPSCIAQLATVDTLKLADCLALQAQQPSSITSPTRALSRMPSFGRSISRSLSRGTGSSSSGSTMERAAATAAAMESQPSSSSQGGMLGMAVGVWRKATSKLFDLEAKIANQVGLDTCT